MDSVKRDTSKEESPGKRKLSQVAKLLSPTGENEDDLNQSHSSSKSFDNNHTGSTRVSSKYEK